MKAAAAPGGICTRALVAAFPFSEGTGNPTDTVGAITATRVGTTSWETKGLFTNGGRASFTLSLPAFPRTVTILARPDNLDRGDTYRLISNGSGSVNPRFTIYNNSAGNLQAEYSTSGGATFVVSPFTEGEWVTMTMTLTSSALAFYKNGALVGSSGHALSNNTMGAWDVGNASTSLGLSKPLEGAFGGLLIHDAALTAAEVAQSHSAFVRRVFSRP